MTENEYMDADYEVISMVNGRRGPGGLLPRRVVRILPEDRAEAIIALDERIQKVKRIAPFAAVGAAFLLGLLL